MTACASGCRSRGQHLADCAGDCSGCLPTDADAGTICRRCEGRLRADLVVAPDLVAHLLECVEPGSGGMSEHLGKLGKASAASAPLSVAALAAADDLHADIASWVLLVIEQRHVVGPSWRGSVVRPASKTRDEQGPRYHEPAVVGVRDAAATGVLVSWLLPHTRWVAEQEWAAEMVREVTRTVRTLRARWPMEDRPVYLPMPCPACQCQSLVRYAPRWEGGPVTISCYLPECGHVIPEDRYLWMTRLAAYGRAAAIGESA